MAVSVFHTDARGFGLLSSIMAIGTVVIAFCPTYASIGIAAPIIVLLGRLLQGFSAGVELGGVSVYLSEISTPGNRGFYTSFQSSSQQVAIVVASILGYILSETMPADVVTAWVAFTESSPANGNMRVVPGSHRTQVPHVDTFHPDNLLSRGQEIAVNVDDARGVDILLRPGEMSLHHVRMVHGSPANRSNDRRIGFAIRYVPTYVSQIAGERDSASPESITTVVSKMRRPVENLMLRDYGFRARGRGPRPGMTA